MWVRVPPRPPFLTTTTSCISIFLIDFMKKLFFTGLLILLFSFSTTVAVAQTRGVKESSPSGKQERLMEQTQEKKEARLVRITQITSRMQKRLETAIKRLENIIARFESHLEKINKDTTQAEKNIASAKASLDLAKTAMPTLTAKLNELPNATEPKAEFTEIKELVKKIKDNLTEAHRNLKMALGLIKK